MSSYGLWLLLFAVIYTFGLIGIGKVSKWKAKKHTGYFVGGRSFNKWIVAFCITGLFSGSTFISIVELSYLTGVSAIWYGVAEITQIAIIALVIIGPFRKKLVVTVTGLIGDRFGRTAIGLGGAITAFTFPMWAVATAIAFASAVHVFTGFSLAGSVALTAILLYVYLQAGGMWSIAFTQTVNFVLFHIMFVIGMIAFLINPGIEGFMSYASANPDMFQLGGAGIQVIVAWFGTFLVNAILAQAAFQMALSCKTPEEGQKGLQLAIVFGIPFIVMGALFGISAAIVVPGYSKALVALPQYMMETLPAPLVGLFFLGVWACALSWGAPCQFSGATSLGKDVGKALHPSASSRQLVTYTKRSLLVLTALMVVFGTLRTEQSAWWNVMAWTMRNSATFAPVVGVLFWRLATKEAVLSSMVGGFLAGTLWYYFGDWHPEKFFLHIHPVWIGMSANMGLMMVITLIQTAGKARIHPGSPYAKWGYSALALAGVTFISVGMAFQTIYQSGLLGIGLFLIVISLFVAMVIFIPDRKSEVEHSQLRHYEAQGRV